MPEVIYHTQDMLLLVNEDTEYCFFFFIKKKWRVNEGNMIDSQVN